MAEEYTFDPQTGLLTRQQAKKNGTTVRLDLSYEYNGLGSAGNLTGKTGHLSKIIDNLNNAKNREYEFDAVGRLLKAKGGIAAGASGGQADWTQTYCKRDGGGWLSVPVGIDVMYTILDSPSDRPSGLADKNGHYLQPAESRVCQKSTRRPGFLESPGD